MIGWIKFHRKILENPIFLKPELFQLFSYCLLRSNHSDTKIIWNDKEEILEKGCFITGRKVISEDTGQKESTIYRNLKLLEKLSMITVKSNNKYSVVKVLNYCVYQGQEKEDEQPMNNQRTTSEQPVNTDKNVKKDKNEKNERNEVTSSQKNKFSDDAIELYLASELFNLIIGNNPKAKKPNLQTWAKDIDLMMRSDERSAEDIETMINWCQRDSFWQGNILSPKKLRDKFDQLTMKMNITQRTDKPFNQKRSVQEDVTAQWLAMHEEAENNGE